MLTSNDTRHRASARRLARETNLVGIVSEAKVPVMSSPEQLPEPDQLIIRQHFMEREAVERRFFGSDVAFPDTKLCEVPQGAINAPAVLEWVQQQQPDLIVLYGTGLLKQPLLSAFENRIVNIHLGLSPYYRGAGTNFWPLVNREPEYVGATIHLAVERVDAGGILLQVRPSAERTDRSHELGTKTIMQGFEAMATVLTLYLKGQVLPHRQDLSQGRVFKRKDFNAEAVRTMWRHFDSGMMDEYLATADERRRRCPIIDDLHAGFTGHTSEQAAAQPAMH
jgi:folate-dependent phosphoribosylglycinamide formyltransferase PurN